MSDDITKVLENWDYRLGRVDARRVKGEDGVDKLQLRIDLGLLQMNAQFRPDGKRPFGHPTLLDHFLIRLEKHREKNGGEDNDFSINPEECAKLQQEAIQYHHRSICNFELEDYEAVERDTEHILELLDFVQEYADGEEIGQSFQQFRPQTIMMQIRAVGTELIAENNYEGAIEEITNAIEELNQFYSEIGRDELVDSSMEIHSLGEWLKDVEAEAAEKKPMTEVEKLQHKLNKAIEQEDYEAAAKLRDELAKLDDKKKG
ncbi:MAG: UvrB/UvrC motif-containing protein [Verrucomicrobiota bacterium]|nr:UvrB/UvrC motif-containing protein [Verrucomicrobiota bacterium]